MTDMIYGIPCDRWEKHMTDLDRRQFELKATDSLIWWLYSEELFRSSEVLASHSIIANNKSLLRSIAESEKNKGNENYSRQSIVEEDIESSDSNQIRIAYFLLARAIELLLKAVIIEMKPDSFFKKFAYKLRFDKKGHDIFEMMKKVNISLTLEQEDYLKLLSHYPFIGTYPIPLKVEFVTEERNLKDSTKKNLGHKNYEEVSIMYDLVLNKYNEILVPKGKTKRINYLKIKKDPLQ